MKQISSPLPLLAAVALLTFLIPSGVMGSRYDRLLNDPEGRQKLIMLAEMESRGLLSDPIKELIIDPDPLVRTRCAEILGVIDDPLGTVFYLSNLCADEDPSVVSAALYSLGLAGWRKDDEELVIGTFQRTIPSLSIGQKIIAVEALGRTRLKAAIPIIMPYLKNFNSSLRSESVLALAALGDSSSASGCVNSIHDPDPHVVACAVYALGRLGYGGQNGIILPLLQSDEPEVVFRAAEALGRLKEKKAVDRLAVLIESDNRWISIKTLESLSMIGTSSSAEKLEKGLESEDTYIVTTALRGIALLGREKSFDKVLPFFSDESFMVRSAALEAAAATGGTKAAGDIMALYEKGDHFDRMVALEMLGEIGRKKDLPLLVGTLSESKDHLAREGAAAGLGRWKNRDEIAAPLPPGETSPLDALLDAAGGGDPVVASIAIDALGPKLPGEAFERLAAIFASHGEREDGDRKLSIINLFSTIGPKGCPDEETRNRVIALLRTALLETDPRIPAAAAQAAARFGLNFTPDPLARSGWDRGMPPGEGPALPCGNPKIVIATRRGKIEIELFGDDAPQIVNSILYLAREGFYDGLRFHRVVPGFVIQGGCPRGDGWGDAGYFLRSEFNNHSYERGTVGMAHAGKDTPGSQFFIAQTPQPHLDGRYTVVGRVTGGIEVVDRIEVGDTFGIKVIE